MSYPEPGIFPLNSYPHYLTCGPITPIHGFNITTYASDPATPNRTANSGERVTRGFELVTPRFELVTRGFDLVTREFELATRVLLSHVEIPSLLSSILGRRTTLARPMQIFMGVTVS